MVSTKVTALLGAIATVASAASGTTSSTMGPAAIMWPEDRVWSAEADSIAPCGSTAGVGNRTPFPLSEYQPCPVPKQSVANSSNREGQAVSCQPAGHPLRPHRCLLQQEYVVLHPSHCPDRQLT